MLKGTHCTSPTERKPVFDAGPGRSLHGRSTGECLGEASPGRRRVRPGSAPPLPTAATAAAWLGLGGRASAAAGHLRRRPVSTAKVSPLLGVLDLGRRDP